jgi:hypothetical protein
VRWAAAWGPPRARTSTPATPSVPGSSPPRNCPLYPGDFIGSGTVGRGCGLELGAYLKAGDVVELEVEGIGVLRNRVVA